nr:hypothetical protein [Tanacetum cinerariifolium]
NLLNAFVCEYWLKPYGFWYASIAGASAGVGFQNSWFGAHESGAEEEDSYAKALLDYEAEQGMPLMVSELAMHNKRVIEMMKEECLAFLEIKRRKVECGERELVLQKYRQRQEDISFYMEALRADIRAK